MLLNALGVAVDEEGLLDRLDDADWRACVGAETGQGLPLRALPRRWQVALAAAEAGEAWVAVNLHLARFYDDGTAIGHWSPVGAYDAGRDRALVLEVYKKDYAPHWAPLPHLAEALALRDPATQEPRGYAVLRRTTPAPA
jgi:hypothetical protein